MTLLFFTVQLHWRWYESCQIIRTCFNKQYLDRSLGKIKLNSLNRVLYLAFFSFSIISFSKVYWIGPLLGGIIGAFTYEYTHDSADNSIKRTLKKKRTTDDVERTANIQSCTSASTEIAFTPTPTSEDLKL